MMSTNLILYTSCHEVNKLSKSDIKGAKYAILAGDPGRVGIIAKFLENPKKIYYGIAAFQTSALGYYL